MTSTGPSGWRASASWRPSCAATPPTWPRTSRAATCIARPSRSWPGEPVGPRSTSPGRRLHQAREAHDAVTRDPGFWLLDDGRTAFERAIGFRPTWRQRGIALGRRAGLLGYLGLALVGLVLTLGATLVLIDWLAGGLSATVLTVVAVLGLLPFSDLSLAIVNQRLTHTFHASVLPGLALRTGVPAEHRTLVVIPTLLDSPQRGRRARGAARGPLPGERVGRDLLRPRHRLARQSDRARRRRRPNWWRVPVARSSDSTSSMATTSCCCTGPAGSTRRRVCGWAGSASAASWTS